MINSRALVVDRDAIQQALLASVLKQDGFRVDCAERTGEALDLLQHASYAILVIDSSADGIDELLARISPESRCSILIKTTPRDHSFDNYPVLARPVDIGELRAAAERCRRLTLHLMSSRPDAVVRSFSERSIAAEARSGMALSLSSAGELDLATCFGYPPGTLEKFLPIPIASRVPVCAAVRTRQPVWLASLKEAAAEYPLLVPLWDAKAIQALAAVPIVSESCVLGVVGWGFAEPQSFGSGQRELLLSMVRDLGSQLLQMPVRYLDAV